MRDEPQHHIGARRPALQGGELAFVMLSEFPTNVGLVVEVKRIALRVGDWAGVAPLEFVAR